MKINIEIEELLGVKHQNESIGERLSYLDKKLKKLYVKEKAYEQRTEEELADVKRLEELGLQSLFKKVIGNLEQSIEQERKEYLAAVLEHKSIEEEIELLEYERKVLKKKFKQPIKIDIELDKLVKKKEFLLKSYDTKFSKELFKNESELGRYKLLNQKVSKSIRLADAATKIVSEIAKQLEKFLEVEGWPIISKGIYAGVLKKSYIDKARAKAIQANVRLEEFGDSVQMLFREKELKFDMDPFVDFIDHFHDNLIEDYQIKRRLESTLKEMDTTLDDVYRNKNLMLSEQEKYNELISKKELEIRAFVLDYETKKGT